MTYMMCLLLLGFVLGMVVVASNPSPYFAALGLVVVAGVGCVVLVGHGGPFLSIVLFLIYLGGMLVVFAYSAALAAEPYPEGLGSSPVLSNLVAYSFIVVVVSAPFWGEWHALAWVPVDDVSGPNVLRGDVGGVALVYSWGGGLLVISAWVLLLTLLVVLELTRGLGRGALRAV